MTSIEDCRIVELGRIPRPEGSLTSVEGLEGTPFEIARVYYLYDIPGGATRAGHAHKRLEQLMVALMGGFDVVVDDGVRTTTIHLNRAYYGLYIPRLIWRELTDFSSGGICMVLASLPYDEGDYFRDYSEFLAFKKSQSPG
jgi:hypothetical protein